MSQSEKELGITIALLERFEKETLPEGLWIKERVDKGELLTDSDMNFLGHVLENAQTVKGMVDHQPEWQSLYASAIHLYEEIIAKGLENQRAAETQKTA
jgi:hypothetical protein